MSVVDKSFNPSGNEGIDEIKLPVALLEEVILKNAPEGKRRGLALAALEAAAMFAVKSAVVGDS